MISEETASSSPPPTLELFSIQIRDFLYRAFPKATTKSALAIEVAHRTEMSMDHVRKIFDGKVLPMPATFRALLALGPETKLSHEVSDLYRKLRVEFVKRHRSKNQKPA